MRHAACSMQHARWVMIAGLGALVLHTSLKQADSQRPEMSELRRAESRSEQSPAKLVRGAHRYIYGRRQAPPGSCWTDTLRSYLWDTIWAVRWPCRHQIIHIERFIAHTHIVTVRAVKWVFQRNYRASNNTRNTLTHTQTHWRDKNKKSWNEM